MSRGKRTFATIDRRASGRWRVRYTDPTGRRRSAPHTFETRINAEAFVVSVRRRIDRDQWKASDDNPAEQITFGVYAQRWLANRQVSGRPIKSRTREHYERILDTHLVPEFGHRQLTGITPRDVRDWYERTLEDRPTMRSHAYSLLRTIMASAINEELVDSNPCRITGAGRAKRVHKIRPASVAELGALTEAMPEKLQLMVTLASWCAMRFGELVELRRGDIDLGQELIRVRRAAVRISGGYQITTPKSDAGIRDVDIPPHVVPLIEAHLARYVAAGRDALIFGADGGGHLQPSTLYRHWDRARDKAGRPDLRFHDLRHSGAVLAAISGATIAELMQRLGHSSPSAALRYQHAAAGRGREIAAQLSKLADT